MMWNNDCGSVPIVDDQNKPIGMVTDRDIAMSASLAHRPLWEITTGDVNNDRTAITCGQGDDIKTALDTMKDQQVRRLAVVNDSGELSGIVSIGDLVKFSAYQKGAKLPYKDTMATLKTVTGHH
jgi:CBS domain-containing protein